MTFHFGFKAFSETGGLVDKMTNMEPWLPTSWPFTWWGWVGVQVFFLISGLVIAFSARSSEGNAARFVRSRILRLLPVVLIASIFALAVELVIFGTTPEDAFLRWIRTVIFWPFAPWIMGQFWTLGIEISFYALVLVVIAGGWVRSLPKIAAVLIVLSLLYWSMRVAMGGFDPLGRVTALLLLQHGAYFGMGVLLAEAAANGMRRWHLPFHGIGLLVAALQISIVSVWESGQTGVGSAWPVAYMIFVASFLFAVMSMRWNLALVGWIGLPAAAIVRTLGMMTFPLYLIHNHVGKPIMQLVLQLDGPATLAVIAAMSASLLGAWWIAVSLEPRLYRLLAKIYDKATLRLGNIRTTISRG